MAKTSLKSKKFTKLEDSLLQDFVWFKDQHDRGEQNHLRIARGGTLKRLSRIIGRVAAMGDPQLILDAERHCERFYLASFAVTTQEKQASMKALQTMQDVKRTLAAPMNPEQYKTDMRENLGSANMDTRTLIPQDTTHLFVRSQAQRLIKAHGQMATPPERDYFRARKEALQAMLKLHEKNCQKALDLPQQNKPSSSRRR